MSSHTNWWSGTRERLQSKLLRQGFLQEFQVMILDMVAARLRFHRRRLLTLLHLLTPLVLKVLVLVLCLQIPLDLSIVMKGPCKWETRGLKPAKPSQARQPSQPSPSSGFAKMTHSELKLCKIGSTQAMSTIENGIDDYKFPISGSRG